MLWILVVTFAAIQVVAPQQPQPLDPLTAEEARAAERVSRADPRVLKLLGVGGRVNHVEFLALKNDKDPDAPTRHAEVLMLRDDAQYGVRVLVRLGPSPAAISVQRVQESNVPMTEIELQSAARVAAEDPAVRAAVGAQLAQMKVEGLRIFTNDKKDPCFAQRCVRLLYRIGADYLSDPIVIVNLSKPTVLVERRKR